ncbi:class I SAM-dependent DNA methyltransferase [Candidatus Amarolinea dominans]|uniref:type I restriction-modification system subunit M n=1 Tax=Candidatus Amarolinea dominans TaxID=3140696 RepID=UPI0031CCBC4C
MTITKRQTNETLRSDMWRACDILRRDNNVGGVMQYTEHLAWLLFLKFLDEEEQERLAQAALGEGEHYEPVLQGDLAWDAWAGPEKLATWRVDDLIQFVRGRLLPGLSTLTGSPLARTVARIFSDESVGDQNVVRNVPVCASGYNLKDVLTIINSIHFGSDDDIYTISQVYEDLLERMGAENRIAGEFYTPRSVIRFMVDVIAPQIGETVYDPASGSAGFLVAAYEAMQPQERTSDDRETLQHRTLFGQEKKGVSALLGTMNMVLHRVATPNITRTNTLEESVKGSVSGRFDVVLTNPPFGGTEGGHIQQNFPVKSNATELLFLEHIIKKLKHTPDARCGVVVPEGTLFRGGAFAEVKKDLLEQFHLFAVVSLPPGTFAPYSDVKTALLFFQRPDRVAERNPLARHETWYYELPLPDGAEEVQQGQPDSGRALRRGTCGLGRVAALAGRRRRAPFLLAADARAAAEKGRAASADAWVESADDLKARGYDLSARNPVLNEREALPHPAELTARLLERTRELTSILENLHAMVSNGDEASNGD